MKKTMGLNRFVLNMSVFAVAACGSSLLTGCGGGGAGVSRPTDRAGTAAQTTSANIDSGTNAPTAEAAAGGETATLNAETTRSVGGARRGIQAVYFLALNKNFAAQICNTLNAAPGGKTIEIEFSAAHDGGQGWANAQTAARTISGRGLNLAIDFGHHTLAGDMSASDWGKSLYTNLFKDYNTKVNFVLEVANEDEYPKASDWQSNMQAILRGLRAAWQKEKSAAFPYGQITIRRCSKYGTISGTFKIDPTDANGFATENEFHFPAGATSTPDSSAQMVSNDGLVVYNGAQIPAVGNGKALSQISLTNFKNKYSSRGLLWHPILHRWSFKNGTYYDTAREDASDANKQAFLTLLAEFMK